MTTAHAHDHPDFLRHHFDTPQQQFEAGKLGMWMFLATEVLLFGGLFCGYTIWRSHHPEMFKAGSLFLNTTLGAVNTAVLIASSLTMAAGVTMAQRSRKGPLVLMLALTLAGAVTFLVIKYFEYTHKFHVGIFPGLEFYKHPGGHAGAEAHLGGASAPMEVALLEQPPPVEQPVVFAAAPPAEPTTVPAPARAPGGLAEGALEPGEAAGHEEEHYVHPLQLKNPPANVHMFFNLYFLMTGLHGVHVLVGIIMLTWLLIGAVKGRFNAAYFTPVDLGGLYWHIVDLIWIFLFPLFYLI